MAHLRTSNRLNLENAGAGVNPAKMGTRGTRSRPVLGDIANKALLRAPAAAQKELTKPAQTRGLTRQKASSTLVQDYAAAPVQPVPTRRSSERLRAQQLEKAKEEPMETEEQTVQMEDVEMAEVKKWTCLILN